MLNKSNIIIKIMPVVLVCFILLPFMNACKPSSEENNNNVSRDIEAQDIYTSREIADAIVAVYTADELPESGLDNYFSGAAENSENYIDSEKIGNLINQKPQIVEEFDYLEDFALYVPAGLSIFEIDVLKIKKEEENNIGAVKAMLEKRIQRVSYGDLVQYAAHEVPILENAKVITVNNYVILLATPANGKAEQIINNMIKGGGNSSSPSLSNDITQEISEDPIADKTPASMDEIVNIEPEILFDFNDIPVTESLEQATDAALKRTAIPRVDVKKYSHNTMFIIGGKCEAGAMIRVTGGTEEIYTGSDHGDYLVEVPFSSEGSSTLKLSVESPGKAPSDEITFIVKPQKDVDMYDRYGAYGTIIGENYMSYVEDCMADYLGDNLISDAEIESLKTRTAKKISDLRDKNCDAEIIYVLVPNTVRTWAEYVPKRFVRHTGDTLVRQWKEGVTSGGATVLDLTELMANHKNDEFKIWHKTDTHWTEYGAYLGYEALMNYIAKKFPDAAPRPRSDFEFYNKEANFGDIFNFLELNISDLKETSSFVRFKFEPPVYNSNYNSGFVDLYNGNSVCLVHDRVQFPHTTNTNLKDLNLPSAYIFRDSFEGPLHAFYTDRFSTATFKGMWDYSFNANQITSQNPDYIIYILSERNIKGVLYN